ncbi:MAG: hypothetical protein ABFQ53_03155, partial [Patescibacteria group bacterium]
GILIFIFNVLISAILDIVEKIIFKLHLGETLESTPIISLFDIELILVLVLSVFVFVFVFLAEKNGLIIITSEYHKNHFISFFRALRLSIQKTPRLIYRKLREMRLAIFVFVVLYILWKILVVFSIPGFIMNALSIMLVIYGTLLVLAMLFHYTSIAYITCLEPTESYRNFLKNASYDFIHEKTNAFWVFYAIFFTGILLWLVLFYIVIQTLTYFSHLYPTIVSSTVAFFIAFTIISLLITLSILKTVKISLMSIIYFEERKRQGKSVSTETNQKQPLLSKNIYLALIAIFTIVFIGGAILTTTIKTKTDTITQNTTAYIEELRENNTLQNTTLEDINLQYVIREVTMNESSALEIIESIIITFFAYIIE